MKLPHLLAIPVKLACVQGDRIWVLWGSMRGAVPLRAEHQERVSQHHRKKMEACNERARKEERGGVWS